MEAKVRKFRDRRTSYPRHHPDGGTFHLYPLDVKRAAQMQEEIELLSYQRDEAGNVIVDPETNAPKLRPIHERGAIDEQVKIIRKFCVAKVTNFVNADAPKNEDGSWNFITLDEAQIEDIMSEISERTVTRKFPVTTWNAETRKREEVRDEKGNVVTETREVPASEHGFVWVIEQAQELAKSGLGEEEKNS